MREATLKLLAAAAGLAFELLLSETCLSSFILNSLAPNFGLEKKKIFLSFFPLIISRELQLRTAFFKPPK